MPFWNSQGMGLDLAPVDPVLVPPVVVTAPNVALAPAKVPSQFTTYVNMACPVHNMLTIAPATVGTPGAGVASGTGMLMHRYIVSSTGTAVGNSLVERFGDAGFSNNFNAPSIAVAPGNAKVMSLK